MVSGAAPLRLGWNPMDTMIKTLEVMIITVIGMIQFNLILSNYQHINKVDNRISITVAKKFLSLQSRDPFLDQYHWPELFNLNKIFDAAILSIVNVSIIQPLRH